MKDIIKNQPSVPAQFKDIRMAGYLVDNDRQKVAQKKPELLAEFDRIVDHKKFSPVTYYPIEITLLYQRTAAKMLYGSEHDPQSYYKLGVWDYHLVLDTQLGRILKALYFKDVRRTALAMPLIMNASSRGMRVHSYEKGEHEVDIVYDNDPYPQTYFKGVFEETLRDNFHINKPVIVENLADGRRVFKIAW